MLLFVNLPLLVNPTKHSYYCMIHGLLEVGHLSRYRDGLRREWCGFDSRQRQEIFLYSTASKLILGPIQPPIYWGPFPLFPGVKWPGSEADHSPPSTAIKNGKATPPLPIRFHCVVFD
jgi:hypothetical protein